MRLPSKSPKTGIEISIQQPTGNPTEKLSLMLASGDYPDVVVMSRGDASLDKYISSGAFIPLDELIEKYGADLKQMYGDTLTKTRYTDGKTIIWQTGTDSTVIPSSVC